MGLFAVDVHEDGDALRVSRGAPQVLWGAGATFLFGIVVAALAATRGPGEETAFDLMVGGGFAALSLFTALATLVVRWEVHLGPDGLTTSIHPFGLGESVPLAEVRGILVDRVITEGRHGARHITFVVEAQLPDGHALKLLPAFRRHDDALAVRDALQAALDRVRAPLDQRAT